MDLCKSSLHVCRKVYIGTDSLKHAVFVFLEQLHHSTTKYYSLQWRGLYQQSPNSIMGII